MRRSLFAAYLAFLLMLSVTAVSGQTDIPLPNLTPEVRNFSVTYEEFNSQSDSVLDECIAPGEYRLLRFDTVVNNIGTADAYLGNPEDNPQYFIYSYSHGHYHVNHFLEYRLLDLDNNVIQRGFKQGFCLLDAMRIDDDADLTPNYDCEDQGITAGWADVYDANLPCQFISIKSLEDGIYILEVNLNPQHVIFESTYHDNLLRVRIILSGDEVFFVG